MIKKTSEVAQDHQGGIITMEGGIHVSKVKVLERYVHVAARNNRPGVARVNDSRPFDRLSRERGLGSQGELGYTNVHQVPKVEKVVVNMGRLRPRRKAALADAQQELAIITGQKPAVTHAKKSISNFKVREGQAIGGKVTSATPACMSSWSGSSSVLPAYPRLPRRVPVGFDGHGNYTLGVKDQSIFPEVELDKIKRNLGFDVTIVTTANSDAEAKALLAEFGFPFQRPPQEGGLNI